MATEAPTQPAQSNDILRERIGPVELLTFNRPDSLNALSPSMISSLPEMLQAAEADPTCRAVVLTGSGDRAFCAGIDVKSVAARDESGSDQRDLAMAAFFNLDQGLGGIIRTIHHLRLPVIAAVNGHAIGAGLAISAACDFRIASDRATFADGFVKRGISGAEMGVSYFLPRLVGAATAFDWMMIGRRVTPEEAQRVGYVGSITAPEDLLDAALALGGSLAENAPLAISTTKEVMWLNLEASSLDAALALEARNQSLVRQSADAAEARQAFLEKRKPVFGG